jgi:hypothetical protein
MYHESFSCTSAYAIRESVFNGKRRFEQFDGLRCGQASNWTLRHLAGEITTYQTERCCICGIKSVELLRNSFMLTGRTIGLVLEVHHEDSIFKFRQCFQLTASHSIRADFSLTVCISVVTICTNRFNIQKLYVMLTQCIYVFCVDLRTNSDYFTVQH